MPTALTLDVTRRDDGTVVLTAAGEIDLSNIEDFDRALTTATGALGDGGAKVLVDLRALEYMDSAAINALFLRSEHIHVVAPAILMSTLAMTGLTELVPVDAAPPG